MKKSPTFIPGQRVRIAERTYLGRWLEVGEQGEVVCLKRLVTGQMGYFVHMDRDRGFYTMAPAEISAAVEAGVIR